MEIKELYREVLNEHNIRPSHKRAIEQPTLELRGVNPSCGDNIFLQLKIEGDLVKDAAFTGSGCAVSQASCDMMCDFIIGKTKSEALGAAETFIRMIKGEASEEEIETLDEASILRNVAHMPARVKCAVLGWHTMEEMIKDNRTCSSANCDCGAAICKMV